MGTFGFVKVFIGSLKLRNFEKSLTHLNNYRSLTRKERKNQTNRVFTGYFEDVRISYTAYRTKSSSERSRKSTSDRSKTSFRRTAFKNRIMIPCCSLKFTDSGTISQFRHNSPQNASKKHLVCLIDLKHLYKNIYKTFRLLQGREANQNRYIYKNCYSSFGLSFVASVGASSSELLALSDELGGCSGWKADPSDGRSWKPTLGLMGLTSPIVLLLPTALSVNFKLTWKTQSIVVNSICNF